VHDYYTRRAAGGGDFNMLKNKRVVKILEKDMVEIIADYIIKNKEIKPATISNIRILK